MNHNCLHFHKKVTVTEADSAVGRRKSTVWNAPSNTREFKVVYPLKADYYILHATTEGTLANENRLSRLCDLYVKLIHFSTNAPLFLKIQIVLATSRAPWRRGRRATTWT